MNCPCCGRLMYMLTDSYHYWCWDCRLLVDPKTKK